MRGTPLHALHKCFLFLWAEEALHLAVRYDHPKNMRLGNCRFNNRTAVVGVVRGTTK